ncbi:uncharacterized protein A4U43_C05F5550 [Asparagus officinalis]|uniref:Uncharacterized protein n=1 Tax=Asparagus officinalis TaxID=4686 RepID=A0A5P1ETS8_ASPOF|nr:uncharacterized protein A4U43_C05F5550 [Asparagus officinalis]
MDSSLRSGGGRRKIPIVKIEKKEAGGVDLLEAASGALQESVGPLRPLRGRRRCAGALGGGNPLLLRLHPVPHPRILSTSPPTPSSSSSSDNVDELWWEEEPIERMSLDELRVFRGQLVREMQSIEAEEEGFWRSRP